MATCLHLVQIRAEKETLDFPWLFVREDMKLKVEHARAKRAFRRIVMFRTRRIQENFLCKILVNRQMHKIQFCG